MKEVGIDISSHVPTHVNTYLHQEWDYVITVCGGAHESCPMFTGNVCHRLHIGFDDPAQPQVRMNDLFFCVLCADSSVNTNLCLEGINLKIMDKMCFNGMGKWRAYRSG